MDCLTFVKGINSSITEKINIHEFAKVYGQIIMRLLRMEV